MGLYTRGGRACTISDRCQIFPNTREIRQCTTLCRLDLLKNENKKVEIACEVKKDVHCGNERSSSCKQCCRCR